MKKIVVIALALGAVFASQAQTQKAPKLANSVDSVSYSIGVDFGTGIAEGIKNMPGAKLNTELILNAFSHVLKGGDPVISREDATEYVQTYYRAQIVKKNKEEGEAFLAKNKKEKGVIALPSGLQYQIITAGSGTRPTAESSVTVNYEGFLLDGTKFDSSVERGEPATFGVSQVISGWTEALQLMPQGSKWKLFIPANLAYGDNGAGNQIPPYSTLIFDVELLEVK